MYRNRRLNARFAYRSKNSFRKKMSREPTTTTLCYCWLVCCAGSPGFCVAAVFKVSPTQGPTPTRAPTTNKNKTKKGLGASCTLTCSQKKR
jgi:hypothetical protein